ncbi:DUF550 domain-containing protein [Intestinirhabdus alba]|nr:DUF550 domain-containing protein [Intestinirhabdus alba]
MNNKLTDEQLSEMVSTFDSEPANITTKVIAAMAVELQERRKAAAEPVRYLNKFSGVCVTLEQQPNAAADVAVYIPLYAAAPAPVAPEEMPKGLAGQIVSLLAHNIGDKFLAQKIWNACRAAMLQCAEPVSNRDELREKVRCEHAEWSDATFGDVGPVGPLKHLSKEALEAAANPEDPLEWADMQFLLWDAQRRMGISDEFITRAMVEKLEINKSRRWPEPKDGEPRLHIKEGPESALPEIECDICRHVSTDPEGRHYCCEDNSND